MHISMLMHALLDNQLGFKHAFSKVKFSDILINQCVTERDDSSAKWRHHTTGECGSH